MFQYPQFNGILIAMIKSFPRVIREELQLMNENWAPFIISGKADDIFDLELEFIMVQIKKFFDQEYSKGLITVRDNIFTDAEDFMRNIAKLIIKKAENGHMVS